MSSQITGTQRDIQRVARNKKRTRRGCADFSWWSTRDSDYRPPIFIRSELRLCFSGIYAKKYPKKPTSYSEEEPSLLGTKTQNGINLKILSLAMCKELRILYADSRRQNNYSPYPTAQRGGKVRHRRAAQSSCRRHQRLQRKSLARSRRLRLQRPRSLILTSSFFRKTLDSYGTKI